MTIKRSLIHLPLLVALALNSLASAQAGINKCTDANGKIIYSDQECGDTGKSKPTEIKNSVPQSQTKGSSTAAFDPVQYCKDGNRDLTDAEMTARMETFSRSGYKGGQICCDNGKVVQCASLLK
jgi:hypothetical protein